MENKELYLHKPMSNTVRLVLGIWAGEFFGIAGICIWLAICYG